MYCLRPFSSSPVARMWPSSLGQIHTLRQAGGMASAVMRALTSALLSGAFSSSL